MLPRRLNSPVRRGERVGYVELRSARGLLGRVPLVADRAGGGRPALVPWLRSLDPAGLTGSELAIVTGLEWGGGPRRVAPCS